MDVIFLWISSNALSFPLNWASEARDSQLHSSSGLLVPPRKDKVQLSISVLLFSADLVHIVFLQYQYANVLDNGHFLQDNWQKFWKCSRSLDTRIVFVSCDLGVGNSCSVAAQNLVMSPEELPRVLCCLKVISSDCLQLF